MPAWVTVLTVYCQDYIDHLNLDEIKTGIAQVDWLTLAEDFNIAEDVARLFIKNIVWKSTPTQFLSAGQRPVVCHLCNNPERVKEEVSKIEIKTPQIIKHAVKQTKSIVALELGHTQLKTMNEIVAFEIAYWLSEYKHGFILDSHDYWYDFDTYRWTRIKTSSSVYIT